MSKKDYSQLAKEDLLKIIEKLESGKKYGLVWDEEKTKEKFEMGSVAIGYACFNTHNGL